MRIDNIRAELNVGGRQQIGRCIIKLHLHIGTEKTGTTSFQHWTLREQTALAAKGILQPNWPEKFVYSGTHRMLAVYGQGFEPYDDGQAPLGLTTRAEYTALCQDFEQALDDEIENSADGAWILSSEHMHSRLKTVEQVQRLAALLQPRFSEITVHIHLRPQVDMVSSMASTLARIGLPVSEKNFAKVNPDSTYYNFSTLVARWETVFGAAHVRVIPYKRQRSICQYFLNLWQLDPADFGPELEVNGGVDWRTMALVNHIHPHRQQVSDPEGLRKAIAAVPVQAKLQIGMARAKEITARMQASNCALVQARPELTMDDFEPDWAKYDQPENLSRVMAACEFSAQMVSVISELQAELNLEKARLKVSQAEKLLGLGKKWKAKERFADASELLLQIEPVWGRRRAFTRLRNYISKVVLDELG